MRSLLAIVCGAMLSAAASAQSDSLVNRLPAGTWMYLHWRGTASLNSVRDTNALLRLWRDPSFVVARQKFIANMSQEANAKNPKTTGLTPEETNEILSLLENQAIIGFTGDFLRESGNGPGSTRKSPSSFLIYDAAGKQDLINAFLALRERGSTEPSSRTPLPVGDVTAYKVMNGKTTSYEAQAGRYFVRTDTLALMEELLPKLASQQGQPAALETISIPSACEGASQSSLLTFVALTQKLELSEIPASPNFNFAAFAKAIHLDQIRAVCGHVTLEAQATRISGAVLGDTSAGSILNIVGDDRQHFATMALAPADSAYECSILDFASLYKTLLRGLAAGLPPDKAGFAAGIDSLASALWGMPAADVLGLFTGEFATIRVNPAEDPTRAVYAFTIQHSDKVLAVLQRLIPGAKTTETEDDGTTFVTLTTNPKATQAQPSTIFFAVTPAMLIASREQELVRDSTARLRLPQDSPQTNPLANDPAFKKARATAPQSLTSLSYTDMAHYNFAGIIASIDKSINDRAQAEARIAGKPAPAPVHILQGFNPAIIGEYLHISFAEAWKDSAGIHFDSFIQ